MVYWYKKTMNCAAPGCVRLLLSCIILLQFARVQSVDVEALAQGGSPRLIQLLDKEDWKFLKVANSTCSAVFPEDLHDTECMGLVLQSQVSDQEGCEACCCGDTACSVWQWCPQGASSCPQATCWIGKQQTCKPSPGWITRARNLSPAPAPSPGAACSTEYCMPNYDDAKWQHVNLPHDFILENEPDPHGDAGHGYKPFSIGWYRLPFQVPESQQGKIIRLDFDGVQRDSTVYLNGKFLGVHPSGYTPFGFDITSIVNYGEQNLLAVKVDSTTPDGWWYEGGGIYRHVWLTAKAKVSVDKFGVYLPTIVTGEVSDDQRATAVVKSSTTLHNAGDSDVAVLVAQLVTDASGEHVATAAEGAVIGAGSRGVVAVPVDLKQAQLWSDNNPIMYSCITRVTKVDGSEVLDEVTTSFGVRKMEWDANRGFILNGKPTKIKGMANHQDFAGVGVAVPDNLQGYRVSMLQEMGANGWRTAHNPPTEALLDECDRRGMLVWAENHRASTEPDFVSDLESLILRDRNHPSIVLWSLCNEAFCEGFNATAAAILKPIIKTLDPDGQRPVTAAMNVDPGTSEDFKAVLDVMGFNYHQAGYDAHHQAHPDQPIIGSETSSDYSDRSIYANDPHVKKYVSAYDVNFPAWGASAEDSWCAISSRDFVAGGFYWTGFDYKGEPTPYDWPNINSHFGVIDIAGFPKDNFYYHQSVFFTAQEQPILHIFPHWNWDRVYCTPSSHCRYDEAGRQLIDVWAYTNGASVELLLNNKSLGKQSMTSCRRHANWTVPFEAGQLDAAAYDEDDKVLAHASVSTTGPAKTIDLRIDWPLRNPQPGDIVLVRAQLLDSQGRFVATASSPLTFSASGGAQILGVGNGDPSCHEADKPADPAIASRTAWNGLARVVLQVDDIPFKLEAEGIGLQSAALHVTESKPASQGDSLGSAHSSGPVDHERVVWVV